MKQVHVVILRVDSVPSEFGSIYGNLPPILRNYGKLAWEIFFLNLRLNCGLGKPRRTDGFQNDPVLNEAIIVGHFCRLVLKRTGNRGNEDAKKGKAAIAGR